MKFLNITPHYLNILNASKNVKACFVGRCPEVEVSNDREATIKSLKPTHEEVVKKVGFLWSDVYRAEQVHGDLTVEIVSKEDRSVSIDADGLMTKVPGVVLGIYVADCGAIYLLDEEVGGIALLHSGRKGTDANILGKTIEKMSREWGSNSENIKVVLSPCIRPPHYETDFAADIQLQALEAGVLAENYLDCGICTGENVQDYYSYRMEKGNTGRCLALLGLKP